MSTEQVPCPVCKGKMRVCIRDEIHYQPGVDEAYTSEQRVITLTVKGCETCNGTGISNQGV